MSVKALNVRNLKDMMDNNEDFVLVDCREQGEWDQGHIAGAKFIPLSEFDEKSSELENEKSKMIVMQCRSGKRSLDACMRLLGNGYKNVANLEGGILDWCESGYETTTD